VTLGYAIEECFKSLKGSGVAAEAINLLWEDMPLTFTFGRYSECALNGIKLVVQSMTQ